MKKIIFIILYANLILIAQEKFSRVVDEKSGKEMIVGVCDFSVFADTNYSWWFDYEFNNYEPDSLSIEKLKSIESQPQITIILGTWCSDSKREVPRFYKILKQIHYDENKIKLICVDRKKEVNNLDITSYNIKFVPTFIFEKEGKEIGRIIETPQKKLEEDILEIFLK
ncbi:MAG: thioredoxin family protein [Melioribacteraceae bacterium]|nr:thioredoxin family protein [Melioribacteraceae bacterium]